MRKWLGKWLGKKWVKICLVVLVVALIGLAWSGMKGQLKTSTPVSAPTKDYIKELEELKEMVANLSSTGHSIQHAQMPQPVTVTVNPVINVNVTQTVNGKEGQSSWQQSSGPFSILNGDFEGRMYDHGGWFLGKFKETRIDHDWGSNGPELVVWKGSFSVPASGDYSFQVVTDGGAQLYVDDYLIIDKTAVSSYLTEYTGRINLSAGSHKLVLKYYGTGDATCRLLYAKN